MADGYISQITLPDNSTYNLKDSNALPLSGGSLSGGLEIKGQIKGDNSGTTGHGLYSGGGYHKDYNNIILHGDASTGTSGIAFVSDKIASDGTITNINAPSDRAFIQYHANGITTTTAEGTAPTLATTGEAGRLVIGIGNDSGDKILLQAPGNTDILHQKGATGYPIPHTINTNGSVGGTTTPVYVEAGEIKAGTALGTASQKAESYFVKAITSTDNAIARFNGTSGQIQNSGVTIDNNNHLTAPAIRMANTYYGISFGRTTATPVETILHTGIQWVSSKHMPVIHITGYAYGLQSPVEFKIGFYIYGDKIGYCGATNMGSWQPDIYLYKDTRNSTDYVAVGLAGSCYFLQLSVDVQDEMGKFDKISTDSSNWSWEFLTTTGNIPQADGGTSCCSVPYKASIFSAKNAQITTTANAIAYYTNTTGTFGSKASANGALYATSANGALQWGTLPLAQGGTGATTAANARTNLGLGTMAVETATEYAKLVSPDFSGVPTAPTANAGTNTDQIATTAFVNSTLSYINAMKFKGTLGTGGTITSLPASHEAGDTYRIITAGTWAGKYCEVGTLIICIKDGTASADADWTSVETNEDGAVIGPAEANSSTDNAIVRWDGTSGRIIQNSKTTIDDQGRITITHIAGSSTELEIKYGSTIDFWWGVGTANENHGMYDIKKSSWIISAGADNNWSFAGNSATATKLAASKTLWGQSFNGSANVTGNLIDVGNQIKLLSGQSEVQFLTSTGGAANGKFGKLGLNTSYANVDFTNYILDVNGKTRIGALDGGQHVINGNVQLNAQSGSYNEGLRINRSTTGYANIYLGGTRSSASGNQTGGWWIGTLSTPADATSNGDTITNTVFTISNNNTSDTLSIKGTRGATIGTNSGWAIRPRLAVGTTYNTSYNLYVNGTSLLNGNTTVNGNLVPGANNTKTLGSTNAKWSKLYVGSSESYGNAYQPVYWNDGVPAVSYPVQYSTWSISSGDNTATLTGTDIFTADTYVISLVVTSGEQYLNGPITWTSAANTLTLSTAATSGIVEGYVLTSIGTATGATCVSSSVTT